MTPKKPDSEKKQHNGWTKPVATNVTPEIYDRLGEIASAKMRQTGRATLRSDVLREAIAEYIARFDTESGTGEGEVVGGVG
jgi:predicted transcriptional regulator